MSSRRALLASVFALSILAPTGPSAAQLLPSQEPPVEPAERLAATVDEETDRRLEDALARRLAPIDGLEEPEVRVEAGWVYLRGTALSAQARDEAESIARRTEGVVEVENAIEVTTAVGDRLVPVLEQARERLRGWVRALPLLGLGLLLVVAFGLLARWVGAREAWFGRLIRNPFMADLVRQISATTLFLVGLLLALELVEATALVGALLGAAGLFGVAMGFAFRDLAENYIASLLLTVRQPFEPNDWVSIDGEEGKVVRLTSRATILMTLDGNHLRLPNSRVFKATILNHTRNPLHRFSIDVGVGVAEDLVEAQRLGVEALAATDGVLGEPEPWCEVVELGDSSVLLRYRAWVDQRLANYLRVRSSAVRRLKEALDAGGVEMPEPGYRVRLDREEAEAAPPRRRQPRPRPAEVVERVEEADAVDRQIAAERAESEAEDLLAPDAPQE